jgi:hypothetical protein
VFQLNALACSKWKEHQVKKAKKRKQQSSCNIADIIDSTERIASKAVEIYKAVQPIAKAIVRRKTK